ncbi:MAG TPA: hypothetical protein DCP08_03805 [Chloroflexi bacterium]|nr:hypothetical protein [Chloroflexota bacterium]
MSLADIWDRFFWSLMIAIFVGLVWLKFLDPVVACVGPGLIVAAMGGGIYFYLGWRRATRAAQTGESSEEGRS